MTDDRHPSPRAPGQTPDEATRPASLWPSTAADPARAWASTLAEPTSSQLSRFDPLAEQRERAAQRLAARLDPCQPALALRLIAAVQVVVGLTIWLQAEGPLDALRRLAPVAFGALAASLVWLVAMCALRARWPRWRPSHARAVAAAIGAFAALVAAAQWLLWSVAPPAAWSMAGVAVSGATIGLAAWTWLTLRAAGGQPADASARLAELQSRIRPHFLFNALNTALALVRVDPARAEIVLEDLAQLFRAALAETGAAVTLDEEVDLAQRYLAIEKLRYGDRLQVTWELDPAAARACLPPLVLQPLVENAVRHGIEALPEGGRIVVHTIARRGLATLWVTNSARDEPGPPGAGLALANVRERLRLLHDMAGSLEVWREPGLFHARIHVPLP